MNASFFDGMAAAFDLVAQWRRENRMPEASALTEYAAMYRDVAQQIREVQQ